MKLIHGLLVTILLFVGCSQNESSKSITDQKKWMRADNKIKVLSTIAMISDIVARVGGDDVASLTLIKVDLDPHSYQLVKGDDEKFSAADIIFYNGLGLEHGPSLQQNLESNLKAVAVGNSIMAKYPEKIYYFKGQIDPHVWMDISLWMNIIPVIVEKLVEKDPVHAENYKQRGDAVIAQLEKIHEEVREQLQAIPEAKRYLVTSHDAFNYFARAYLATDEEFKNNNWQKRFAAPEGLAPESQISVTDIQNIIDHLSKYNIETLFPESNVSPDSLRKIVSAGKEKGLNLRMAVEPLYGDSMGGTQSEGNTYPRMIKHDAEIIASYLK